MSPEQASGQRIDRRSDIFALGIVLFELTTGERLFRGESPAHTLQLVTHARVPNPRQVLPDYPERLAPIVLRALARDPDARFQTADEMRVALDQYLVQDRVLVSHAGVGKLVRKVLMPRLEAQDEALRKALLATDGMVRAGLVPEVARLDSHPHHRLSDPRLSDPRLSDPRLSEPPLSNPVAGAVPYGHSHSGSYRPRRAPVGAVLFGALGVAAAVGAIIWTTLQAGPNALVTAPGAPRPAAATGASDPVAKKGVSFDGIPITEAELGVQQQPAAQPARPAGPQPVRVKLAENAPPAPAAPAKPVRGEKVSLEETESTAAAPAAAEEVTLDESAPPPTAAPEAPPPGERGPISRGAALSALAAAGNRAKACSNPEGPSGSGRVMVTFSPDGPVSNVSLPAPFAGTSVGSCIATAFRSARVPAFTGSAVTLPGSFRVP
jgi:hypothetical protein